VGLTGMDEAGLREVLVRTSCDLIAIPSTTRPGDTAAIMSYARARLAACGYAVEVISRRPGVDNLVARLGRGRPSTVFNAHADTVAPGERRAWRSDPFHGTVEGDHLTGLGACNCKGPMAVQLWLAEEIARRGGPKTGEAVFTFVGDEEALGPDGTSYLREAGMIRPDRLIVAAPTANQLIIEERGVLQARLTAHGRAAHAGDPAAGDNAILRALKLVAAIERGIEPALAGRLSNGMRSTINIGVIAGGTTANVVPSRCTAEIDRRLLPGETVTHAFAELGRAAQAAGEPPDTWRLDLATGTNGFAARRDAPLVRAFADAYAAHRSERAGFIIPVGASDARYFADDGIEILVTGPGDGAQGHAANETMSIAQLVDAAHIHLGAAAQLLGV
jgi:acetylornithine deacetylase/succinyl-diaminopimelate desuccinylase family protein